MENSYSFIYLYEGINLPSYTHLIEGRRLLHDSYGEGGLKGIPWNQQQHWKKVLQLKSFEM